MVSEYDPDRQREQPVSGNIVPPSRDIGDALEGRPLPVVVPWQPLRRDKFPARLVNQFIDVTLYLVELGQGEALLHDLPLMGGGDKIIWDDVARRTLQHLISDLYSESNYQDRSKREVWVVLRPPA